MEKNKQILCCIFGSAVLALLNNHIFEHSKLGIFQGGYGGNVFGELIVSLANILSLVGFILLAVFSIILIIENMKLKDR